MKGRPVLRVELGDRLELRKPHPCGSRTWTIRRLGADLGLTCDGCGRRLLLERAEVERRLVRVVGPDLAADADVDPAPGSEAGR